MSFSPEIFRQYDIRGIVGETIDSDVARATGSALVTAVSARTGDAHPRIVVGSDNRPSSDGLA
ncbi:MAG: phosphomannomutase, partial [Gammaproteobacteria bacterium]|nr:phosphomannomutase [Gammaproteobacteria bacterium]